MPNMHPLYFINYYPGLPKEPSSSKMQEDKAQQLLEQQRIPRPRNAFILYRQQLNSRIIKGQERCHSTSISKLAGALWKTEPAHVQEFYRRKADEEKILHAVKYPGYTFRPKKKNNPVPQFAKLPEEANSHNGLSCMTPPSRYVDDSILDAFLGEMEFITL